MVVGVLWAYMPNVVEETVFNWHALFAPIISPLVSYQLPSEMLCCSILIGEEKILGDFGRLAAVLVCKLLF